MQWARYGHPLIHINVASNLELRILVVLVWARYRHPSAAGMLMAAPSEHDGTCDRDTRVE